MHVSWYEEVYNMAVYHIKLLIYFISIYLLYVNLFIYSNWCLPMPLPTLATDYESTSVPSWWGSRGRIDGPMAETVDTLESSYP